MSDRGRRVERIRVLDPGRRRAVELEALVDPGAALPLVIPRSAAEELGLKGVGSSRASAWIELRGRSAYVHVVVVEGAETALVGASALIALEEGGSTDKDL